MPPMPGGVAIAQIVSVVKSVFRAHGRAFMASA
jgi:hypothetical protein